MLLSAVITVQRVTGQSSDGPLRPPITLSSPYSWRGCRASLVPVIPPARTATWKFSPRHTYRRFVEWLGPTPLLKTAPQRRVWAGISPIEDTSKHTETYQRYFYPSRCRLLHCCNLAVPHPCYLCIFLAINFCDLRATHPESL